AIDPRFLAYRDLLAHVQSDGDSVALANAAAERRDLLRSVTDLGQLEAQLDQFDRLLAAQRERLAVLQHDFLRRQPAAVPVVLSGPSSALGPAGVGITRDDGSTLSVPLSDAQRDALRHGGAVQVFHGYVEPREQTVQIELAGPAGPAGAAGYVTLDPA